METYHFDKYRIRVGDSEAVEIEGTIIGPFGVAKNTHQTSFGHMYAVTHLHSGLSIRQLKGSRRGDVLVAATELSQEVPWWASHKPGKIADKNGLTLGELKEITEKIARRNFCEGVENSGLPDGQP